MSEELFAAHFWWCHDRLQARRARCVPRPRVDAEHACSPPQAAAPELGWPPYFYFLTLLALRVFHAERVDVAVLEVGLGGRWDATNVVPRPVVCGVTSLGYDHMDILGHTLTLIAGEKAGIIKPGIPVVTTQQPDEARVVLEERAAAQQARARARRAPAKRCGRYRVRACALTLAPFACLPARRRQKQAPLIVAPPLDGSVQLGLSGAHQRLNAAMAVQLCRLWAARARPDCTATAAHEQARARRARPTARQAAAPAHDGPVPPVSAVAVSGRAAGAVRSGPGGHALAGARASGARHRLRGARGGAVRQPHVLPGRRTHGREHCDVRPVVCRRRGGGREHAGGA